MAETKFFLQDKAGNTEGGGKMGMSRRQAKQANLHYKPKPSDKHSLKKKNFHIIPWDKLCTLMSVKYPEVGLKK